MHYYGIVWALLGHYWALVGIGTQFRLAVYSSVLHLHRIFLLYSKILAVNATNAWD